MISEAGTAISAETLKRAYLTIQNLQRKLADADRARREPIAVIGIGCRLPGGVVDAESYWQALVKGTDAVRQIPSDRWDVDEFHDSRAQQPGKTTARTGGFLEHIDRFDHEFFGISRGQALATDPQQRLTLEVVWEALENAGQAPSTLAGSRTGVFAAVCTNDFAVTTFRHPRDITEHTSHGTAHSAVAGMVSYCLDLRGPSVAVDTACSSSLVAVHLASQSLRSGECDLAVSGGVNVIMSPMTSIAFSQAGMLSRSGRSRPFDAAADGPVNGEGCGFVVLKRLSDALRDDDPVLAVLLGSAVNHNGRSSAPTAPSSEAQSDVIRSALRDSGVSAGEVAYVEAHASSTPIGDVMEAEALAEVYHRVDGSPLLLGTVKGNFGHLQAAGGIAALIKVVLSLKHGTIPATLHLTSPNPDIPFDQDLAVPTALTPWPTSAGRRVAGVSTFGFTGTNAHLLVGQAPQRDGTEPGLSRPVCLLALSAKTSAALARLAERYAERMATADVDELADICYSANVGRAHFSHRLAIVGRSTADMTDQLRRFVAGRPEHQAVTARQSTARDVVFLFPGQGTERIGMAATLLDTQPTFGQAIAECDEILRPTLERPLHEVLGSGADPSLLHRPGIAHPALFSVEYALARLWRSWGIEPAAVIGHGLGEYVAACVAETMSLADALRLAVARGRLVETLPVPDAGHALAEQLVAPLRHTAEQIRFSAPSVPMVSTVDGRLWPWQQIPDAEHWCRQIRLPTHFAAGVATLREMGYRTFLEVGPGPALLPLISDLTPADDGLSLLPCLAPDRDDWQVMLDSLALLYVHGADVDWSGFDRDHSRSRVEVPTYPFEPTVCRQTSRPAQTRPTGLGTDSDRPADV